MENAQAKTISHYLSIAILDFNVPLSIQMDNAAYFHSTQVREVMEAFNIHMRFCTRYNSRANGLVEVFNRKLQDNLRLYSPELKYKTEKELRFALRFIQYRLNGTKTNKGYSPMKIAMLLPSNWPFRLPEISETRKKALSTRLREAYEYGHGIWSKLKKEKLAKVELLENREEEKRVGLRVGDIVKIKTQQKPGELKKYFRPWSSENYKVLEVLRFAKTVLVERLETSEHVRRLRLRTPIRYTKKVETRDHFRNYLGVDDEGKELEVQKERSKNISKEVNGNEGQSRRDVIGKESQNNRVNNGKESQNERSEKVESEPHINEQENKKVRGDVPMDESELVRGRYGQLAVLDLGLDLFRDLGRVPGRKGFRHHDHFADLVGSSLKIQRQNDAIRRP